jgi:DNA-binding MarR family transcriptional regulator
MRAEELTAFDRAFELAATLGDAMNQAFAERGLTTARAEVLHVMHHQGPLMQRQLAEALRCTPRHVTTLVDTLENTGLVHRGPHPTDRRATLVTLTDHGRQAAQRMDDERRQSASALLGNSTSRDLRGFITIAQQLLDHIGHNAVPTPDSSTAENR